MTIYSKRSHWGQTDYEYLGPLDDSNYYYLDNRADDKDRKRVLTTWYGKAGSNYAWQVYQKRRITIELKG